MRQFQTYAVVVLFLGLSSTAHAAPIMIDGFTNFIGGGSANSGSTGSLGFQAGNSPSIYTDFVDAFGTGERGFINNNGLTKPAKMTISESGLPTNSVFGGNRTTTIELTAAQTNNSRVGVVIDPTSNGGILSFNQDAGVDGKLTLSYDFSPTSFANFESLVVDFFSLEAGTMMIDAIITDGGSSQSSLAINQPVLSGPFSLAIPFSSFSPIGIGANINDLKNITLVFNGSTDQDFSLNAIRTTEVIPEPATLAIAGIFGVAGLVTARRKLKKNAEVTTTA